MSFHENVADASVHTPFRRIFADAAARLADAGPYNPEFDLNKFAVQEDDNTLWRLTDESPVTWTQCGGGSGGADLIFGGVEDANFTVTIGEIPLIDLGTASFTMTLPASPADNDRFGYAFSTQVSTDPTRSLTIDPNGHGLAGPSTSPVAVFGTALGGVYTWRFSTDADAWYPENYASFLMSTVLPPFQAVATTEVDGTPTVVPLASLGLTWDTTLQTTGFTADPGRIYRVDSTATLTVTLPDPTIDGALIGIYRVGVGTNVTTIDSVVGNPAFTHVNNATLMILRYNATDTLWLLESDFGFFFQALIPQTVLSTGATGVVAPVTIANHQVLGRPGSGNVSSVNVGQVYLAYAPPLTGSGNVAATAHRLNPYEGTSGLVIDFPAAPANNDELAFKEVAGLTNSVVFNGNGNNVESPLGVVGANFASIAARAFYKFKYYSTGSFWAFIR